MKERELKLENFRIIQDDSGLKIYPKNSDEFLVSLLPKTIEPLKIFLNSNEEKKEISYLDRTYLDKRRILRQLSIKDEIRNYLNIMTDKIWEMVLSNKTKHHFIEDMQMYYYIKTLLIDGFISFEVIFDDKQKDIIDLKPIDPCSLIPQTNPNEKDVKWIQHNDNEKLRRVLSKNQIIYISYSFDDVYSPTSYIEELKESYEKVKRLENELLLAKQGNLSGAKIKPSTILKELRRADKKLQFMSKIPKSILKEEKTFSDDVRYNKFIRRMCEKFENELIRELIKIKNNL